MRIDDIPIEGHVNLQITKGELSDTISVYIQKVATNMIALMPVEVDGKTLILNDKDIKVDVIYVVDDDKPLIWKNVAYGMLAINNKHCIVLKTKNEGVHFNRRMEFRLPMDITGSAKGMRLLIHDISRTGISFKVPKNLRRSIGETLEIHFMGGYEEQVATATIVRELEDGERYLYGCTIKPSIKIDQFISDEQRRRLMQNRMK